MVSYPEIKASNASINDATAPRVAVFVGGTSGIGKLTINALVLTGASMRVYLIGRKSSEETTRAFIQELEAINSKAEIIWTEAEISLLAETKRVCEFIKRKENSVDLLFLSAGYAPFGGRKETSEGIEITTSLEYYSRLLFIQHLLPLPTKSSHARVVSILGGGLERANSINLDDLDLKKPGAWSLMKVRGQFIAMQTIALDKLAADNPGVTFIHNWPGSVNTGNVRRGADPNSWTAWLLWLFMEPIIWLVSSDDEVAGQRHLFQCTSAAFGGRGTKWSGKAGVNTVGKVEDGLFLVDYKCDATPNDKVITVLRERTQEKVWGHTKEVLRP